MGDFKAGKRIILPNDGTAIVKRKIGEGGQGAVYLVSYNEKDYALKWYLSSYIKNLRPTYEKFYNNLSRNISSGSPSKDFLWPLSIAATGKRSTGFGYLMELRPDRFCEFTKFIKAKEHFSNTQVVIKAAINVVEAFQALHKKGLSYQDVSPGNFFIDKDNGDILICDNDNVAPYGENLGVSGTPGYMAPEIILGTAKPNIDTDLFSLSVILFELFFLSHPLEGANCCKYPCLTTQIERELYAEHPVFVMSKTDHSNAPVKGVFSNLISLYPAYPAYLHEAFEKAFGEGLKDVRKRLSEGEWKKVLYRLIDDSVECPSCHEINFASMGNKNDLKCTNCSKKNTIPCRVKVNSFEIVAGKNKQLTDYHLNFYKNEDVKGTFLESKKTPGVFGLRNDSNTIWRVEYKDQVPRMYENGKVVMLMPESKIYIDNKEMVVY